LQLLRAEVTGNWIGKNKVRYFFIVRVILANIILSQVGAKSAFAANRAKIIWTAYL